jgi:hypothetical protein
MRWSDLPFDPPPRTLRQFAGLWLIVLTALAGWQGLVHGRPLLAAGLAALGWTLGPLGLVRPRALRPLFVAGMVAAFPLGWAVSRLLLAAVFYGVVTPLGLLLRLSGRDPLGLRPRPDPPSYWAPKPTPTDLRRYFRQF